MRQHIAQPHLDKAVTKEVLHKAGKVTTKAKAMKDTENQMSPHHIIRFLQVKEDRNQIVIPHKHILNRTLKPNQGVEGGMQPPKPTLVGLDEAIGLQEGSKSDQHHLLQQLAQAAGQGDGPV
ncbi:unnamed protein product [Meganyctiphanes norvegica]|uniref:Uncharacterized protein n=1 Tax=Meganyctiphanes norvegica TaxID=48144 RepID=A0AAV2RTG5_MEGNR